MRLHLADRHAITPLVGKAPLPTDWVPIDQYRVNQFAQATGDHQWIHVDPVRAATESPFGGTIAHGFLTLSLVAPFLEQSVTCTGLRMGVNYGLNKVRFIQPVKVGSRVRGLVQLLAAEDVAGSAVQLTWSVTIEIEGSTKPACVAECLVRWYF
jgi:acyl dehydratase